MPTPPVGSPRVPVLKCFDCVTGLFLGLFLGHVNVRSARRDVRFKVKEEYNSYRVSRGAILTGTSSFSGITWHLVYTFLQTKLPAKVERRIRRLLV